MARAAAGGTVTAHDGVERVLALSPADDRALRALLRCAVIPGAVRVAFTREPQYARGEGVAGAHDHLVVARHAGRIAGMGRASVRELYRNGVPQRVAYLGGLRLAESARRGARLLRDGYRLLADALAAEGVDACFTSVTSDNRRARRVLEHGGRLGLPPYAPLGALVTLVAPVPSRSRARRAHATSARSAWPDHEVMRFLDAAARPHHLTLPWDMDQWERLSVHGVSPGDVVHVTRDGALAGATAIWDQRPFRQVVVDGYAGALGFTRPVANAVLRAMRRPLLPVPGAVLAQGALLGATVATPHDWRALWPTVASAAAERGLSWLTIARDARDPELSELRTVMRGAREYRTVLYDVAMGCPGARAPWDDRLLRPEVGLL